MYKVLLAEDELLVRIGLKNSINWNKFGMEIVAEEESGTRAFSRYEQLRPDVVITDIKMPGMSGLELIQRIREADRRCAIIVISCMNDFELLQKIIRCDVLGYVLKASMTIPEVEELLARAKKRLDENGESRKEEGRKAYSRAELLEAFVMKRRIGEEEFRQKWKESGYEELSCRSVTIFRISPPDGRPLNEMGASFVKSVLHENLRESDILWSGQFAAAFHRERILCTDSRFGRISQMIQSLLEGSFSQVTQEMSGELSALPREMEMLLKLCENRREDLDRIVFWAVDYILNHYSENITLAQISAEVGLSPNYFSTLFKKETGISFVNYLNDIRLEKAKLLLGNTDEYLYQIAEKTGFRTVEHFSQTFKQKEGINPGDYRRKQQSGKDVEGK